MIMIKIYGNCFDKGTKLSSIFIDFSYFLNDNINNELYNKKIEPMLSKDTLNII